MYCTSLMIINLPKYVLTLTSLICMVRGPIWGTYTYIMGGGGVSKHCTYTYISIPLTCPNTLIYSYMINILYLPIYVYGSTIICTLTCPYDVPTLYYHLITVNCPNTYMHLHNLYIEKMPINRGTIFCTSLVQ